MTESRQQRRARERAEQKAAARTGPNYHAGTDRHAAESAAVSVEVGLRWNEDRNRPGDSYWSAEWGERDSDAVVVESAESFEEMLDIVRTDLAERWEGYVVEIEWTLDRAAEKELARSAIELPLRMPVAN
ncbi:hypothetical protein [Nocardia nova]|uniref:hypothetical protein n=1 Tax=Nocardia nova TaxID=37330 RepID=UPI0011B0513A|nr:hypothetical protein [Nocardia nova]